MNSAGRSVDRPGGANRRHPGGEATIRDTSASATPPPPSSGGANRRHPGGEATIRDTSASAEPPAVAPPPLPHVTVDALDLAAELPVALDAVATAPVAEYALWLGDDALILAQQLSAWITRAPELEEDVALANIALDLLGHARSLLRYAGSADRRSEDDLAYFRDEPEFRSAWLFEQPNGDFARTIARQLIASTYLFELYTALQASTDATLAAIAAKAVKEVDYHRDHAVQWTLRLAGGTDESRRKMLRGIADVWPYIDELFRDEPLHDKLGGVTVRPSTLRAPFDTAIGQVLDAADVPIPEGPTATGGGRHGIHFPELGRILAEMQVLARQHPGATW